MNTENKFNGVNVTKLMDTIDAVKERPDLAKFKFRATNKWIDGGHSQTEIKSFYGAGEEDTSRTEPFVLEADEPPVLIGKNQAPNSVEAVLHALASCITVGFIYNAAAEGIKVDKFEVNMEGDLDLHGFLGLSEQIRPGYKNIELSYRVKADASEEKIKELCEHVQNTSPVLDIVRNPVEVSVKMENLETA